MTGERLTRSATRAWSRPLLTALDRLEQWPGPDRLASVVRGAVRAVPLGPARDVLHGLPLGHPLHPLLVQVPVGAWLSAAVLDCLPGRGREQQVLIGVGLVSAAPAAVAGWTDWAELPPEQARVGLVHAAANLTAVSLYAASLTARLRGRSTSGRLLAAAGLAAVGAGGALGGHLSYRQAAGANHAEAVPHIVPEDWAPLGAVEDFPVGRAVRAELAGVDVLVVRQPGGGVNALAGRCSHMAGPLFDGEIADGCVRCPWHGSVFRLSDGWNVGGPATAPQPVFECRTADGRVEARLLRPHPGA
ncbi:Rieske (2Fe-2S) protein [Streptomyces katrae]|uniref:Rieske (2Fe-2S) protein n=1 Tax=Streptomyces katrae TaxID=68223 RepID=A0ABT7H0N8_9ACTN|nr:Rieske (2Fe-2S) protein [Streptomyces katrae]MDK9499451.1 Rieske (2Fe-2S) protein [Streptomyces katrae]